MGEIDAIACAVTFRLVGSLTVGICAAKTLATVLNKPLYGLITLSDICVLDEVN